MKKLIASIGLFVAFTSLSSSVSHAQEASKVQIFDSNITVDQVLKAQTGWCNALLKISSTYASGGINAAKPLAAQVINSAYAYQYGPVAFKPTLTSGAQTFRPTKEGALSYFVGNDPNYPSDKGFALKDWRSCTAVNKVIQIAGPSATTMGNVLFTDSKGVVTTVDKTWNFVRGNDGSIRIMLHHSSLPFGG